MARAKCRQCSTFVNTNDAIKEVINNKPAYWCSEKCKTLYDEAQAKVAATKAEYDEIVALTREIFGYNIVSLGLLRKEINTWETLSTRQKIIAFLKANKDWLSATMRKEFPNDFCRVRYYSTIVSSKLHDFKPKENIRKPIVKEHSFEFFEPTIEVKPQIEKQVLYDVEDDLI
jgi:hypothetical protein